MRRRWRAEQSCAVAHFASHGMDAKGCTRYLMMMMACVSIVCTRKHLRFFFKEKVPATSLRILTPMSSHSYDDTYWSAKCRKAALETPTQDLLTKLCAFAESFSVSSLFTIIRSHILCSTSGMQCRTSRL